MPSRVLPSRMMPSRMSCDNGDLDQSRDHGLHGRPRMVQKVGWQVGKACFGLFTRLIRVFPDRQTAIVSRHSRYPILIVVRPRRVTCEMINIGGRLLMYGLDAGERHNVEP